MKKRGRAFAAHAFAVRGVGGDPHRAAGAMNKERPKRHTVPGCESALLAAVHSTAGGSPPNKKAAA